MFAALGFGALEAAETPKIPGHPRLLFAAQDLPALKKKAQDKDERGMGFSPAGMWAQVAREAQKQAKSPLPTEPPKAGGTYPWTGIGFKALDNLLPLSIASSLPREFDPVAEEPDFVKATKESLLNLCKWTSWGDQPVGGRPDILLAVAIAYDCIHDKLTDDEKATVRNRMAKELAAVAAEIEKEDRKYAFFNNGFYWTRGNFGFAALALLGEVPEAAAWVEKTKKDMEFMRDAVGVGGWNEGYNYGGCIGRTILFADALKRVTGENLFERSEFLKQLHLFALYGLSPNGGGMVNFCDSYYFCMWPDIMAKLASEYQNGYAQWYLMRTATSAGHEERRTLKATGLILQWVLGFLWYDPTLKPKPPTDLPQSYHFKNIGWAMLRSGWGDDDVLFAFKSGVPLWTHCHQDQNHFVINAFGEWLATDQDYGSRSDRQMCLYQVNGVGHQIVGYNGKDELQPESHWPGLEALRIVFSDPERVAFEPLPADPLKREDQPPHLRDKDVARPAKEKPVYRGRIRSFFTSQTADYVSGDASAMYPRYQTNEPIFRRNLRRVVFLKPDCFVILDDLETNAGLKNADGSLYLKSLENRLHIRGEIAVEGEGKSEKVEQRHYEGFMIPGIAYANRNAATLTPTDLYKPPRARLRVKALFPEKLDFVVKEWPDGVSKHFGPYLEIVQRFAGGKGDPFLTVLRPERAGAQETGPKYELLRGDGMLGCKVATQGKEEIVAFRIAGREGPVSAGPFAADADAFWVRRGAEGKAVAYGLFGGKKLTEGGKDIVRSEGSAHAVIEKKGDGVSAWIEVSQPGRLWLAGAPAAKIQLDGSPAAVTPEGDAVVLSLSAGRHSVEVREK